VTFHAGTTLNGGRLTTSGGRVLCVVGLGDSVKVAQKQAYSVVDSIHFSGAQFRRDIGWRALKKHA
jgi:phosphoribosylamine--glycine ligase